QIVKIGERYTVVIPKEIREKLGIKKGQLVRVSTDGRKIILEPIVENPFKTFEKILGDFTYDREARKKAEKELLKEALRDADLGY
ncbi:MAG: hypothetical protein DRZ80_06100, partial [Thermoprotei archaeon]